MAIPYSLLRMAAVIAELCSMWGKPMPEARKPVIVISSGWNLNVKNPSGAALGSWFNMMGGRPVDLPSGAGGCVAKN